jgi:phosphoenolpyruvate-protein phosphotransferase (PTS system enzyme I)
MHHSREIIGRPASDGIFAGPIVYLNPQNSDRTNSGSPETEKRTLEVAIVAARDEIKSLCNEISFDAARILSIQVAILRDPEFSVVAFEEINCGTAADVAWLKSVNSQIQDYDNDEDEYFNARAGDLKDMRDRVLRHIYGTAKKHYESGAVYYGEDIAPTFFLESDWSKGGAIVLTGGSHLSHVAMLARARGVPMVVALEKGAQDQHVHAIVDGQKGIVIFDPDQKLSNSYVQKRDSLNSAREREAHFINGPAELKDGTRIELLLNVSSLEELSEIDPACCDGIGLVRSEFLFVQGGDLPDEQLQFETYLKLVLWAKGKPVTIRTLDLGGDKFVPGLTLENERNPFLGLRGIRLAFVRHEIFRTQLKALARVAAIAPMQIMLPMISDPQEIRDVRKIFDEIIAELQAKNIPCAIPTLGIMVEVPAVAISPELFNEAAFFSIGTNDLIQYVTARSRDSISLLPPSEALHPAVCKLISSVSSFGTSQKIPVSLCGDIASDPNYLKAVLSCGIKSISVAPARISRIKAALREI